ncbi:TPA: hypothetical protein MFA45_001401 [Klebsiella pneumoniae]|nr:hypothetical protein [Klebsiella pneumoniae]HBQ1007730.1 hypothetical protein [Klebsiella pneumoniae]HBQ1226911.1 hypothetical protein [Klebsiella pneumoniae]HBU6406157.1 hypothetical protein [Klebsiella pneumoniae]HBU6460615.1 hypothetical protein [Klebsiella pneumoniae]
MEDLFEEILKVRKIELVARVAAEIDLENEERKIFLSLIAELSDDLIDGLGKKEQIIKSLYMRGCISEGRLQQA